MITLATRLKNIAFLIIGVLVLAARQIAGELPVGASDVVEMIQEGPDGGGGEAEGDEENPVAEGAEAGAEGALEPGGGQAGNTQAGNAEAGGTGVQAGNAGAEAGSGEVGSGESGSGQVGSGGAEAEAGGGEGIEKFLRDHATGAVPEALYERYASDSIAHVRAALSAAV